MSDDRKCASCEHFKRTVREDEQGRRRRATTGRYEWLSRAGVLFVMFEHQSCDDWQPRRIEA